ncbi:NUDIX domain-containing protein [Nocardioides sp. SYSU D00038]|uniref:NUDIX domain-containing protein n=1 Tax=Nocardioides sp. SYSU D00038 TaxID=2812554 RepID=UPI0019689BA7|nr:NUDIX domain-containing protein [Nocardioides sp. SYSU D00038]
MGWATCTHGHLHWGRRGAAGLLLARAGGVLLQLRAGWAHQGGTWSIPGGARERGESAVEAALREAHEELGVDRSVVDVRGSYLAECGGWQYETVLAVPAVAEVAVRDVAESAGHAWVAAADVDALPLHPAFAAAWADPDGDLRDFVELSAG